MAGLVELEEGFQNGQISFVVSFSLIASTYIGKVVHSNRVVDNSSEGRHTVRSAHIKLVYLEFIFACGIERIESVPSDVREVAIIL